MKYRVLSLLLVMAVLPSVLGVHIFQHHCNGCDENETITRIITTVHSHDHACSDCSCAHQCMTCQEETGQHVHHHASEEGSCKHDFKKASLLAKTNIGQIRFEAAALEVLFHEKFYAELKVSSYKTAKNHYNVIQKVSNEPSPEMNCVFLL
ncbi:hypothetical protein KDU71_16500 [Carboxylicivirga sediminis]|uniref:Uncharacterized protein n=1 Tax=Carboxylicivirga sediminis TaxID=2006564 RepID=A0A941F634_9BACT|nr:hypothetical protein [Carboxylicivirga sediminis]MBR8537172.1 hypothetical protein [Carboxylicivirga sediminis]